MKVGLVGAGAIGCWLGARLVHQTQTPVQLSVLARGESLQAIQAHGVQLSIAGQNLQAPVQASDKAADLGVQDLVLVALKAPALSEVAAQLTPLIGPHTVVLTAMNGVPWWFLQGQAVATGPTRLHTIDPDGVIERAIPANQVLGCVVHASCALLGRGHAKHHFGNGLIVGEPLGGRSERAERTVALLCAAGFDATLSTHIQKDIWYKLWGNMTVNPISAMTGATTDQVLADPQVRAFMSRVMLEAQSIGARLGLPIDQQPEDRHAITAKLGKFKSSMLQDVEARRVVELDALVSAVRELGQRTGVDTPFTDALLGLSRLHAQGLGLYPAPSGT
jgi:2-dehydropantoate 2-reductase